IATARRSTKPQPRCAKAKPSSTSSSSRAVTRNPSGRRRAGEKARAVVRRVTFLRIPASLYPQAELAGEMPCLTGSFQIIEQNQGFGPEKLVASVANRYQAISRGYDWLALAPCDNDATCGTVCCVLEK